MDKVEEMRHDIIKVYGSEKWRTRCLQMPDNQVIAIWHSFDDRGMLDRRKDISPKHPPAETKTTVEKQPEQRFTQMTIFDFISKPI